MVNVGRVSLENLGGFVVGISFEYVDTETGSKIRTRDQGGYPIGQTHIVDPGELGVPGGALFNLVADVRAGSDNHANQMYTYEPGNPRVAQYFISGATLNNNLGFTGFSDG